MKRGREGLGAFAAYLVLALIFTWPLVLYLKSRVLGLLGHEDLSQILWVYWWWKKDLVVGLAALTGGPGGIFSRLSVFLLHLFSYPLRVHMGNIADFPLSLVMESGLGFPAYFNLKALLVLAVNALSGYLLVRKLTGSAPAAFAAGAVIEFNPIIIYNLCLGRMEEAVACWIPLYLIFLLRTLEGKGVLNGVLAGFCLGLAAAFYWYYAIFLLLFTPLIVISRASSLRGPGAGRVWAGLGVAALACWVLVFPFFMPYLAGMKSGNLPPELLFHGSFPTPAQLAQGQAIYNVPTILSQSCSLDSLWVYSPAGGMAPSPFLLIIALGAAIVLFRQTWPWLAGLLGFYVLSWGPHLKYMGHEVLSGGQPVTLPPYLWLYRHLPFFARLSWPDRILQMVFLCIAVLAGFALARAFQVLGKGAGRRWWASGVIVALLAYELAARGVLPIPSTPLVLPPAGPWSEKGGVVELPVLDFFAPGVGEFSENQAQVVNFYQSIHGQKVLGLRFQAIGFPGSEDGDIFTLPQWRRNTFLQFLTLVSRPGAPAAEFISKLKPEDLEALRGRGYRYLIIHERGFQDLPLGSPRPFRTRREAARGYDQAMIMLGRVIGTPAAEFAEYRWVESQIPEWSGAFPLRRLHQDVYRAAVFDLQGTGKPR